MIVISHRSALEFWRLPQAGGAPRILDAHDAACACASMHNAVHLRELRKILSSEPLCALSRPLDLMSTSRADRRRTALANIRCMQTKVPDGALACIGTPETILVSTPEFCFVQMAHILPLWELVELGYELCGVYPGQRPFEMNDPSLTPISTPAKLARFAADAAGMTGAKAARIAARWIAPHSGSLEETHIAMLACMSRPFGGGGTKLPSLNQTIEAPEAVARMLGTKTCRPDLYWPDSHVAVEYDKRSWPDTTARADYERRKRNAYRMMGIDLVCIGKDDLSNPAAIRASFDHVNLRCGKRLRTPSDKQIQQQESLLSWLEKRESQQAS